MDRRNSLKILLLVLAVAFSGCRSRNGSTLADYESKSGSPDVVEFTILQMNDVYEIAPVESGQRGGLARVATIKNQLLAENKNTIAVLAGDFISPSALGVTKINGVALAGKQMIDSLNVMGLDYAVLGNHEFDIPEDQLKSRIAESKFKWVTANVFNSSGQLFDRVQEHDVVEFKNAAGAAVRVGLFGVCTDMAKKNWVKYRNALEVSKEQVSALDPKSDVIIALTHLSIAEDKMIADQVPELEILIGGHEHENVSVVSGSDNTPIYKADANARTVYVHRFEYHVRSKKLIHNSQLIEVDQGVALEPKTDAVVTGWVDKIYKILRDDGIEPNKTVGKATEILDGYESSVRNRPTNLTKLIGKAFAEEVPEADAVVYGSGSIRIDARIPPGPITYFDVIKIFPFGGNLSLTEISGAKLKQTLDQGLVNKGSGGYLATHNVEQQGGTWLVKGQAIVDTKIYKVVFNDFLLTGLERGLPFLNTELEDADVKKIRDTRDVRTVFIAKLGRDMN